MEISKVNTSSFGILDGFEKNIIKFSSNNPKMRLYKVYLPLGKLELIKTVSVDKGFLFKKNAVHTKKNYLYVDLSCGDLYYAQYAGVVHSKPQVDKTDLLRKILDFTPQMLNMLSHILEQGSILYSELDHNIVQELVGYGLVRVYEPKGNSALNILRIAVDEQEISKAYVKSIYYLPKFDDKRFDLSSFLKVVDTIDDSYSRGGIEYSPERIGRALRYLFGCNVVLDEITYMPSLVCEQGNKGGVESISHLPLCLKNGKVKRGYKTEVKLKPLALSTGFDVMDEVPIEKSTISFSDVGGLKNAKKEITEEIIYPLTHRDISKKFGRKVGGGILLYGPPGCGKTQLARAAVTECGVSFFNVNISDIMSEKGDGAEKIHKVFERASKNAPAIIFFDEIDALCSRKGSLDGSKKRILNQFLMDMSGVERLSEDVLIIAATDTPWDLDPALRRSGRFSKQIFISPPDLDSRIEILEIHTRGRPLSSDVDFRRLAELTEGYSAADIDDICNNAASIPWKKAVSGSSERSISLDDFLIVIEEKESTLIPWSLSTEELIESSGEKKVYKDLFETVVHLNKEFRQKNAQEESNRETIGPDEGEEVIKGKKSVSEQLRNERNEFERKIKILEKRYKQGKIEMDAYNSLMENYQEKLIEVELRLEELT